jgi:2-polyprenyl-3-methyl-5-hydroxy-6-metoxy-1,4-benzoquinol methylase
VNPSLIRQRFDQRAARYDNFLTAWIGEQELRQIRPLIPPGATVLDYGCGSGRVTLDLARRGHTVTAFDISSGMLARAQKRAKGLPPEIRQRITFVSDLEAIQQKKWDCITCIGVLDYYPQPRPLLRHLASLLAPDGRLVITFPNAHSPLGWTYALASRFTVPATPRTPAFARQVALESGFSLLALRYAFPALPLLGHTLVLALHKSKDASTEKK